MINTEDLKNYFLGKDPQLKETMADNSLRLIGIKGKYFVLRKELLQRLASLKKQVDEETQQKIDGVMDALSSERNSRTLADNALSGRIKTLEDWKADSDFVYQDELEAALALYYTKTEIDAILEAVVPDYIAAFDEHYNEKVQEFDGHVDDEFNELTGNFYTKSQTYTKTEVDGLVASTYHYKGSVTDYTQLPVTGQQVGDTYNIINAGGGYNAGDNVAWTGSGWDKLAGTVDLSNYYTKSEIDTTVDGLTPKTRTIAGIDLQDNITVNELATALGATNYTIMHLAVNDELDVMASSTKQGIYISEGVAYLKNFNGTTQNNITLNEGTIVIVGSAWIEGQPIKSYKLVGIISGNATDGPTIRLGLATKNPNNRTYISLNNIQSAANLVTSISSSSTNSQYPGAKLVYDQLQLKEDKANKTTTLNKRSTTEYLNQKGTYNNFSPLLQGQATGDFINLTNAYDTPPIQFELLGNATQDTTILTYKCAGTETGDYYFVYSSTNYQFTMPTVASGDILTFNTSTKKLYKGTTQITTTTASTGTLITLSATPNPDYPQDIHVVTGDNVVNVVGKNWLNPNEFGQRVVDSPYNASNISTYDSTTGVLNILMGDNSIVFDRFKENTQYTLILKYELPNVGANLRVFYSDGTYSSINPSVGAGIYRLVTNATKSVVSIKHIASDNAPGKKFYLFESGIFEGDITTEQFEKYVGQTQLLSLGSIELAKIGDYTDKLFKAIEGDSVYDSLDSTTKASLTSGAWYKYKAVEKIVSYNGETITTTYMSTTGGLDTGATVYYGLTTPQFISL